MALHHCCKFAGQLALRIAHGCARRTQLVTLDGLDEEKGPYYTCYTPARLVTSLRHETESQMTMTTSSECHPGPVCQVTVMTTYHSDCSKPFTTGTFKIAR
jgi:hypothetical protein